MLAVLALLVATVATAGREDVEPPEVHARLMVLRADLEMIRFEMGKPPPESRRTVISNVAPREVYFQASTLFRKSNRLSFEHTREIADTPLPPEDPIRRQLTDVDLDRTTPLEALQLLSDLRAQL